MVPSRELHFYASIPKIVLLLLISVGFIAIGWWAWMTQHSLRVMLVGMLGVAFGGVCSLTFLILILFLILFRKPILRFTDTGITFSQPLMPWRSTVMSWQDVVRIAIHAQGALHTTSYLLIVQTRYPDRYISSKAQRFTSGWFPALAGVVISAQLNMLFLRASRERRTRMLERIHTTFAPEIYQYQVQVDEQERPL